MDLVAANQNARTPSGRLAINIMHFGRVLREAGLPVGPGGILSSDEIEQIVRGEVALLAEEYVDDQIALAGALAAGGPDAFEEGGGFHAALNRQPPALD